MQNLVRDPRVKLVKADQCRFGLVTIDEQGNEKPAAKMIGFLPISPDIAKELEGCGDDRHEHAQLFGGRRAHECAIHPVGLCKAICRGYARQKMKDTASTVASTPLCFSQLSSLIEGKFGAKPAGS